VIFARLSFSAFLPFFMLLYFIYFIFIFFLFQFLSLSHTSTFEFNSWHPYLNRRSQCLSESNDSCVRVLGCLVSILFFVVMIVAQKPGFGLGLNAGSFSLFCSCSFY
jgi:hypothetical protein